MLVGVVGSYKRLVAAGVGALMIVCGMLAVASATHDPALLQHSSLGPSGGNGAFDIPSGNSLQASADGSTVTFSTAEALVPEDTDSLSDMYARGPGGVELVSTGPTDDGTSSGRMPASLGVPSPKHLSADGRHVVFASEDRLTSDDNDGTLDLYERVGGTTLLVSTGSITDEPSPAQPLFGGMSPDGSRVIFKSAEGLEPEDGDGGAGDLYERSDGETRLISTGDGPFSAFFAGVSADATGVAFTTQEALVPDDQDAATDLYLSNDGTIQLVSIGPAGGANSGTGPLFLRFDYITADGGRVFFTTNEALVAEDTDVGRDVYVHSGGTTSIVSDGPAPDTHQPADFVGASADGTVAYFRSFNQLAPDDSDINRDLYVREGETTSLVELGVVVWDGNLGSPSVSGDGSRVVFRSEAALAASDTDARSDVYAYENGSISHLSIAPTGGNGDFGVGLIHASPGGERVLYWTREQLVPADTDQQADIYEWHQGTTSIVSIGPDGGNGPFDVVCCDLDVEPSTDATQVYFQTGEQLLQSDTDSSLDVYRASVNRPPQCSGLTATPFKLRPPNRHFLPVSVSGGFDPDGDPVSLEITEVTQDEPVRTRGDNTSPDARRGSTPDEVRLRAERNPFGNGRVYRLAVQGSDGRGGTCEGQVTIEVRRHAGVAAVDSGPPRFDSFG